MSDTPINRAESTRRPRVRFARVPSWKKGSYPRFGAWRHADGFTLRYRDRLLIVGHPKPAETFWICRGWPELDQPKPVKHQWMHAYHEVPTGSPCSICEATENDPDRWDGVSSPFPPEARHA